MSEPRPCPCGRPQPLERCCGPYLRGQALPETAEALMRSRYTAYALQEVDYLVETHAPRDEGRRAAILAWAQRAEFLGLEVVGTEAGQAEDHTGVVEFVAHTKEAGVAQLHRERSRFLKQDGRWFFIDGPAPSRPRVGRNDPCPCGSGKKHKKCCGG